MKNKQEKIELFVPARALEYFGNSECSSVSKKIEMATSRYYLKGDFFVLLSDEDPKVRVFLSKCAFNKEAIGYEVSALISSG